MQRFQIEYRLFDEVTPQAWVIAPDDEVDGQDKLTLEFRHSNFQHYESSASTRINLRGNFYAFVRYWLTEHSMAVANSIECRLFDRHCGKYLYGYYYIKPAGIEVCLDECTLSVTLKLEDKPLKCIKETLVDSDVATKPDAPNNWFSGGMTHPTFPYCRNRGVYAVALIALAVFGFVFLALIVVAGAWLDSIFAKARGCDRKTPSPLITTYLQNLADTCGIAIHSDTVFANPTKLPQLQRLCLFYQPVQKGLELSDNTTKYRLTNALNYTGAMFLEFLQKRLNIKWRINPTGLIIRHFEEPYSGVLMDLSGEDICCTWSGNKPVAYGDYDFPKDMFDEEGNGSRRAYNDIVEYNNPRSMAQEGSKVRKFDDACPAFRNDGLRSDDISQTDWFAAVILWLWNWLLNLPNADDFVMMSSDAFERPKLIVWDGTSSMNMAKAIKKVWTPAEVAILTAQGYDASSFYSQFGKTTYFYNYVMPVDFNLNAVTPNTWQLFRCDNVRLCPCRKDMLCEVEIPDCDCDILALLGIYEDSTTGAIIDYPVQISDDMIGEIRFMSVDFDKGVVKLRVQPTECTGGGMTPDDCSLTLASVGAVCDVMTGMAEVTVSWVATNTSPQLELTVGGNYYTVTAADGVAVVQVIGDGSVVQVTLSDVSGDVCSEVAMQELQLPLCCALEDEIAVEAVCEDCDSYEVWKITVPFNTTEIIRIKVDDWEWNGSIFTSPANMHIEFSPLFPSPLTAYPVFEDAYGDVMIFHWIGECCRSYDANDFEIEYFNPLTQLYETMMGGILEVVGDCAAVEAIAALYMPDYTDDVFECVCDKVCAQATAVGVVPDAVTDTIEWSLDNMAWTLGDWVCQSPPILPVHFRRVIDRGENCDGMVRTVVIACDGGGGGAPACPQGCSIPFYDAQLTMPSGDGIFDGSCVLTILQPSTCIAPYLVRGVQLLNSFCSVYDTVNTPNCPVPDVAAFGLVSASPVFTLTGLTVHGGATQYNIVIEDANGCLYGIIITMTL